MTASEKRSKTEISTEEKTLPGVFSLLRDTIATYVQHFSFYSGYAGWLLIPIVISVLARTTLEGDALTTIDLIFGVTLYSVLSVVVTVIFIKSLPAIVRRRPIHLNLVQHAIILAVPYFLTTFFVSILTFGGLILLIVPGILMSVWFAFAGVIVVIEQSPIFPALKTSRALSEGRFLDVLWRYWGGFAIIWIAYLALSIGVLLLAYAIQGGGVVAELKSITSITEMQPLTLTEDVLLRLVDILFVPINAIFPTLLYLHLKRVKLAAKNANV